MDQQQRAVAERVIADLEAEGAFDRPIVTTLERLDGPDAFYEAEDYHQNFAAENPDHPYIQRWALPKIDGVREAFPQKVR